MADILRVTTPLINKSQAAEAKPNVNLATQFPLQDTTRVQKPGMETGLLQQNNGLAQEETSALLLNLLKDPSVTVNFLKSISSMEAIIKLLTVNNSPFTVEIEEMFGQMLVAPEDIAAEMARQENGSTRFKGELFDFLRQVLRENPQQKELRGATVTFLKALTLFLTRREALGSVGNGLQYLSDSLAASKTLSDKLSALARQYQQELSPDQFRQLRQETLALLKDVSESILFSEKMDKTARMVVYNLSRYNDNGDFLQEAVSRMLLQLRGDTARETFLSMLEKFWEGARQPQKDGSAVMDALTRILRSQAGSPEVMAANADRMERIIHSLLSSPCNFTPLLHFVLPVEYQNMQSFAEIWINPNGGEDDRDRASEGEQVIHMLFVFDIESIGRFELELYTRDKVIDLALYCPPGCVSLYSGVKDQLSACVGDTGYRFGEIRVDPLDRPRSLMDVFRSLPYKRTGVDVKV